MTPERYKKIEKVLSKRQPDLCVVLENVDDPHNIGAILRSCDAFGVLDVHLLYTENRPPRLQDLRSPAAASAVKWLRLMKWTSREKLVVFLKKKKMRIVVTTLKGRTKEPSKTDLTQSVAIIIGNEHKGVSKELMKAADIKLKIPMVGFIQSFNVSVAAALVLYEAFEQRQKKGMYEKSRLSKTEEKDVRKLLC